MPPGPIPDSYWVVPGRLLAGEYPGSLDDAEARSKLERLLDTGITLFLDLTQEDELRPFSQILQQISDHPAGHRRMPIRDFGTPAPATMGRILDTIDQATAAGAAVYVHCWGGIGRSGTVVGCYLVRHGMTGKAMTTWAVRFLSRC